MYRPVTHGGAARAGVPALAAFVHTNPELSPAAPPRTGSWPPLDREHRPTLGHPRHASTRSHPNQAITYLGRLIHERFFWFLLATCAAAACVPGPGLWLRSVSFGAVSLWGQTAPLSLPTLMLAFLLFSAGLGVQTSQLRHMVRDPKPLFAGLVANLALPVAFLVVISQVMGGWHNADYVGSLLVGLALIASMPVAATSTLWSQHANGNLALS